MLTGYEMQPKRKWFFFRTFMPARLDSMCALIDLSLFARRSPIAECEWFWHCIQFWRSMIRLLTVPSALSPLAMLDRSMARCGEYLETMSMVGRSRSFIRFTFLCMVWRRSVRRAPVHSGWDEGTGSSSQRTRGSTRIVYQPQATIETYTADLVFASNKKLSASLPSTRNEATNETSTLDVLFVRCIVHREKWSIFIRMKLLCLLCFSLCFSIKY